MWRNSHCCLYNTTCNYWEKSLHEGLTTFSFPVGMSMGNCLKLINMKWPADPLWLVLFPTVTVWEWETYAKDRQAGQHVWTHLPLLLIVDCDYFNSFLPWLPHNNKLYPAIWNKSLCPQIGFVEESYIAMENPDDDEVILSFSALHQCHFRICLCASKWAFFQRTFCLDMFSITLSGWIQWGGVSRTTSREQ